MSGCNSWCTTQLLLDIVSGDLRRPMGPRSSRCVDARFSDKTGALQRRQAQQCAANLENSAQLGLAYQISSPVYLQSDKSMILYAQLHSIFFYNACSQFLFVFIF